MTGTSAVLSRMEQLSEEYNRLSQYVISHPRQEQQTSTQGGYQSEIFNPQSETTAPLQRNHDLSSLHHQISELSNRLQKEYTERRALEQKLKEKELSSTQMIAKLKQELRESNNDTEIIKDIIKRLNEQLNRYHIKYGPISSEGESHREKSRGQITRSSLYKLKALLVAYDELIKERDAALKSATEGLEKVMVKVDSVTKENEKLHTCMERLTVENPMSGDVAERVAADARILLEERELLMQEVQLIQQKRQQEATQHQEEVSVLRQELEESLNKTSVISSDLSHYREECSQLDQQCKSLQEKLKNSVSKAEHQMAVEECQRLFEQLRSAYDMESGNLKNRVHANKSEKQQLAKHLTDTSAVVQTLSAQVSGLKGSLRKNQTNAERRGKVIHALNTSKKLFQAQLKYLAKVCSELIEDRGRLLQSLSLQRKESEELAKDVTVRSATIGALSQKLKEERLSMSARLAESEGGRRAAKAAWKRTTQEAQQLKNVLQTKENTIASLTADYRLLGLDISEARYKNFHQRMPSSPIFCIVL